MTYPRLIAICGPAGSGKDTVAKMVEPWGYEHAALADPMKRFCQEVFGWDYARLWGPSECRNAPDPRWGGLTARKALQTLGTEWGRTMHPDLWLRYALRPGPQRVFSDLRFKNEVQAFRDAGAFLVRLYRPGSDGGLTGSQLLHPSETEMQTIPDSAFHWVIQNDGTLKDLDDKVRDMVRTWRP